jgi:hypothetical protein
MPTQEERIAQLEKQIAQQQDELARLRGEPHKAVGKPWPKKDWTEGMSMPPSAMREMVRAVPDRLVREVVTDNLRKQPSSPTPSAAEKPKGSGWVEPSPLAPPPGVALLDKMMHVEDARDRADRVINDAMRKQPK